MNIVSSKAITTYVHFVIHLELKALKCKPSAQVMQIAYSNTEHLLGSYVMEKQFVHVQLARKLLGLTF